MGAETSSEAWKTVVATHAFGQAVPSVRCQGIRMMFVGAATRQLVASCSRVAGRCYCKYIHTAYRPSRDHVRIQSSVGRVESNWVTRSASHRQNLASPRPSHLRSVRLTLLLLQPGNHPRTPDRRGAAPVPHGKAKASHSNCCFRVDGMYKYV